MATTSAKVLRLAAASVETTPGAGTAPTRRFGGQTAIGHTRDTAQLAYLSGRLSAVEDSYPGLGRATVQHTGPLGIEDAPLWLAWFLNGTVLGTPIGSSSLYRWAAGTGRNATEAPKTACWELTFPDRASTITAADCAGEQIQLQADVRQSGVVTVAAAFRARSGIPQAGTPVGPTLALPNRTSVPVTFARVALDDPTNQFGTTYLTGTVLGWTFTLTRGLDTRYHHAGGSLPDAQLPGRTAVGLTLRVRALAAMVTELSKWAGASARRLRLDLTAPASAAGTSVLGYGRDAYGTSPYGSPPQPPTPTRPAQSLTLDLGGLWTAAGYGESDTTVVLDYTLLGAYDGGLDAECYATASVLTGSLTDG